MEQVIISGLLFGSLLSFMLGPAFFVLLETSISKGIKAGFVFDFGVISSDILIIALVFIGSNTFQVYIANHIWPFVIGGLILLAYSFKIYKEKKGVAIHRHSDKPTRRKLHYLKIFSKGFALNIINPGVFLFWLGVVFYITAEYSSNYEKTLLFFVITMITLLIWDTIKIFLAKMFKKKLNPKNQYVIRKILATILLILGIGIIYKGFFMKDYNPALKNMENYVPNK